MASNRSWTCIHPSASRIPPDLCLFLYPTFSSSRHCCSSLPDNFYYTPPQLLWGDFTICLPGHIWSGRQDSNLRPPVPKTGVLANWTTSRYVLFSIILRHSCPENSFRLLSRRTDYRRSPLVCTLPLWNSICLITCLSTLTPVSLHIVLGCLVPWSLTLGDNTRALLMFHLSPWGWTVLNQCHLLIHLFCLGSG